MSNSYPSGAKNPLRRICTCCSNTDRTAARRSAEYKKKKDAKVPLTEDDVDVKANINKMSPDEKVAFYSNEKVGGGPRVRMHARNEIRVLRTLALCFSVRSPSFVEGGAVDAFVPLTLPS